MKQSNQPDTARPNTQTLQWAIVVACFCLSGAAGLIYEVCWIRIASLSFGSTTFALSTVLGTFFLGLAIGSHFIGRIAQRTQRPLLLYAGLEIALACVVFFTPLMFEWADGLFGIAWRSAQSTALRLFAQFALISLVILPPTIMMGATFPLFCRLFVRSNHRIASGIAFVYAANTLGAAAGCAATGFYLLPEFGTRLTLQIGCTISLACGAIAFVLPLAHRRLALAANSIETQPDKPAAEPTGSATNASSTPKSVRRAIPILFFLVGFSALGMEIVWARYLSQLVGNTIYTYTTTLTVTLIGIVIGSLLASRFLSDNVRRATWFGAMQVGVAISMLAILMTPPDFWLSVDVRIWKFGLPLILPAAFSGASFPLAIRMAVQGVDDVAKTSGTMAAFNTLGGILGSLAIGFFVLPQFGLHNSLLMITGLSLFVGLFAWLLPDQTPVFRRLAFSILALLLWIAIPIMTRVNLPEDFLTQHGKVVDFTEGYGANISVTKRMGRSELRINGHWQGTDLKTHQIMAAHVPMMLNPDTQSVVVLGIGPGQTASRFLMYDISRLTCVDIEPRLFDVVGEHFGRDWIDDPRTQIIKDDGRSFLTHTDSKFDLISIELGQVFRPGVAAFYTLDFYQQAAARLNDGGTVTQFVPINFFTVDEFRNVIRTFIEAFPNSQLWYNNTELLLMSGPGDGQIKLDADSFHDRLDPAAANTRSRSEDLQYSHWGGPDYWLNRFEMFAACFLLGPNELRELSRDGKIYRDDLPELDYGVSETSVTGHRGQAVKIAELIVQHLSPVETILSAQAPSGPQTTELKQTIQTQRLLNIGDIRMQSLLGKLTQPESSASTGVDPNAALAKAAELLATNPAHLKANGAYALMLVRRNDFATAEKHYRLAVDGDRRDVASVRGLATILHRLGKIEKSLEFYQLAAELQPDEAVVHNNYGIALGALGRFAEAKHEFESAIAMDPTYPEAQRNLAVAEMELKKQALKTTK